MQLGLLHQPHQTKIEATDMAKVHLCHEVYCVHVHCACHCIFMLLARSPTNLLNVVFCS